MGQIAERPPLAPGGPRETFRLRFDAKTAAPAQGQNRAVREARLELLREAIFENLGAAKLFIETVQLLIEVWDDVGARHSLRMGALHFKAAVTSANELFSVKAAGR
jgi:hypothetical protein